MTICEGKVKKTFFNVDKIDRSNECQANTIKGTRALHCVQTMFTTLLLTRTLACFGGPCRTYKTQKSLNRDYVND